MARAADLAIPPNRACHLEIGGMTWGQFAAKDSGKAPPRDARRESRGRDLKPTGA